MNHRQEFFYRSHFKIFLTQYKAGKVKASSNYFNMALTANCLASTIIESCVRSLYLSALSVLSQLSATLLFVYRSIAARWHNHITFQVFKTLSKRAAAIPFKGDKPFRPAFDDHHPFNSFVFVGFSNASAPLLACAKLSLIKAFFQPSNPSAFSMDKNLRHTARYMPWPCHRDSRLHHMAGMGYRSGQSWHRAPVRKIHTMPSKACRLSMGGPSSFVGIALGSACCGFRSFRFDAIISTLRKCYQ